MEGFDYRGHYLWLDPEQKGDRWEARVAVDVHSEGRTERIYYNDHFNSYATFDEALEACRDFGRRMIDNFTIPTIGEGDYRPS